jgi:hypothetical protein
MGYGKVLRERVPLIRFLVNAQKTAWYPVLFAILCIVSGINNHFVYTPIIWVLCGFVVFSALFADDNKVFLVPMLMVYYSIGKDNKLDWEKNPGEMLTAFEEEAFLQIVICGVIAATALFARLLADGSIQYALKKRKMLTLGFVAMLVACAFNGMFNPEYEISNLIWGVICGGVMLLFYFCTVGMLRNSTDPIPYACRAMVCTAYVALAQIAVVAWRLHEQDKFFIYNKEGDITFINRGELVLGWGLPTMIALVFVLGIPAAMYLAKNSKLGALHFGSALIFVAGAVVINTRSALVMGMVALIACCVICCINGKNRISCRICTAALALGGAVALIYVGAKWGKFDGIVDKILDIMRFDDLEGGRGSIWENAVDDFKRFPIFGIGLADGGFDADSTLNNVFCNMYHNIGFQFIAGMGIVGALAFVLHLIQIGKLFFVKFSLDKFLLLLIPLMIIGTSLVDNFFFYPNFQIFYGVFIALAEMLSEGSNMTQKKSEITKCNNDKEIDIKTNI